MALAAASRTAVRMRRWPGALAIPRCVTPSSALAHTIHRPCIGAVAVGVTSLSHRTRSGIGGPCGFCTSTSAASAFRVSALDRRILRVTGKDARTFLQNLCSNDVSLLANPHDAMFTCWLTPKGRAVCEAHVSLLTNSDDPGGESFLLDLDPACLKDAVAHAARYKLRSDVAFHDLSRVVSAFALLPEAAEVAATQPGSDTVSAEATALLDKARAHIQPHGGTIFADPRASGMGLRAHVPHNFNFDKVGVTPAEDGVYDYLRVLNGFLEGSEVVDTIPMNWSFDYFGGVSFTKGCYLGQELMARTKHSGTVRRRVVPALLVDPAPPTLPPFGTIPDAVGNETTCSLVDLQRLGASGGAKSVSPGDAVVLQGEGGPAKAGNIVAVARSPAQLGLPDIALVFAKRAFYEGETAARLAVGESGAAVIPLQPWWWQDMLAYEADAASRQ